MTGMICGTGSYLPTHILCNDDISDLVETTGEWIEERTGIKERHIAENETTVSMAARAGRRALEDAKIAPEEVDMVLVSTVSSNVILPCTACEVQKILGTKHAVCFDINAACSGFLFAYNTALAYLTAGMCRTVLMIGSESLSNLVNWQDRNTCILFGDGAGAAVLRSCGGDRYKIAAHSEGEKGWTLTCRSRHAGKGRDISVEETFMKMDGREVFQFAVRRVPEAIFEALKKNGLSVGDIDYFLLHQANRRIVEAVAKKIGAGLERFPMNLDKYGNTSSASIPILMDELRRNGTLKPGQRILLAGFGAGLSWGAAVLDWKI